MTFALKKARTEIDRFAHSDLYLAFMAAVVFALWSTGNLMLGVAVISALATVLLVAVRDTVPLVPLVMYAPCMVATNKMPAQLWQYAVCLIPLFAAIIFHVLYYKPNNLKKGAYNVIPMALLVVAMLVAGTFSPAIQDKAIGLANVAYTGILPLATYMMVRLYGEEKCDICDYFARAMVVWGIFICMQAAIVYLGAVVQGIDIGSNSYAPQLGWGNSNVFPTVVMTCIPFNFYMMHKSYKWTVPMLLLTLGEFICILYCHSRGVMIFTVLVLMASAITVTVYNRKNPVFWTVLLCIMAALTVFIIYYGDKILQVMTNTFEDKLSSNGRDVLYMEALDKFVENPVFGAGMGYRGYVTNLHIQSGFYQFHSTIFQTLGTLGLFGTAVMLYLYIIRYYTVFKGGDRVSIFFFVAMIGFEGYSIVNTSTFTGLPLMTVVYMFMALKELKLVNIRPDAVVSQSVLKKYAFVK